jgi:hypothetical protein
MIFSPLYSSREGGRLALIPGRLYSVDLLSVDLPLLAYGRRCPITLVSGALFMNFGRSLFSSYYHDDGVFEVHYSIQTFHISSEPFFKKAIRFILLRLERYVYAYW